MLYSLSVVALPSFAEQQEGKPERAIVAQIPIVAGDAANAALRLGVEKAADFKGVELSRLKVITQQIG